MSDISTGMKVTGLSQWKSAFSQAQTSVKTLDAELKKAEAQYKATGDKEQYLADKSKTLQKQLEAQKKAAKTAEDALQQMDKQGVDKASKNYQEFQRKLLESQTAIINTSVELQNLGKSEIEAAAGADKLTASVNGISKKISLEQVIGGINSITSGLENAAKKAVDLGEQIWNSIMDRAQWADDTATMAMMYGIDLDTFLRMQKLVTNGLDTSVEAILGAQSKLKRGIGSDAKTISAALNEMGISMTTFAGGGKYGPIEQAKDSLELFWEVGQKLMTWGDEYQKEDMAQKLFGKGWKELVPLFSEYKSLEEYSAALQNVNVNSTEDVNALAELNDKVAELKGNLETLSTDILAELAPALTQGADALNGLLTKLMEYLDTPDGQAMLERLGAAVSGLFEDIGKIDPQDVISGFTGVFEKIIQGFEWLVNNKDTVIHALEAIVFGWAGLKLTGGALQILQLINSVKSFQGVPTAPPSTVTSDSGVSIATGGGGSGGNWLTKMLNNLTLISVADAFYRGTEGKLRQMQDDFQQQTAGMTPEERNRYIMKTQFHMSDEEYDSMFSEITAEKGGVPVEVKPEVSEDAAANIAQQVGTVTVPLSFGTVSFPIGGGGGGNNVTMAKANGIWSVPYDGYISVLHKGEQVVPAREVSSRNFSSNLYVENMNMNNGQDAAGLAAAIAAANRRTMSGYGS